MGIYPLTPEQINELTNKNVTDLCDQKSSFYPLIESMSKYIQKHKKVFFRLSTLSPKDVRKTGVIGPVLYATSVNEILETLTQSERIKDDLEDLRDFAIILRPWNDQIDCRNEYRCFVINNQCEVIVCAYNYKIIDKSSHEGQLIMNFITQHIKTFPEPNVALDVAVDKDTNSKVIFIEFNSVDNELDTYDTDEYLSNKAKEVLKLEPILL